MLLPEDGCRTFLLKYDRTVTEIFCGDNAGVIAAVVGVCSRAGRCGVGVGELALVNLFVRHCGCFADLEVDGSILSHQGLSVQREDRCLLGFDVIGFCGSVD